MMSSYKVSSLIKYQFLTPFFWIISTENRINFAKTLVRWLTISIKHDYYFYVPDVKNLWDVLGAIDLIFDGRALLLFMFYFFSVFQAVRFLKFIFYVRTSNKSWKSQSQSNHFWNLKNIGFQTQKKLIAALNNFLFQNVYWFQPKVRSCY